jgi:cytochrome b561
MTSSASNEYGSIAKTLHWMTVILIVVAWALGTFGDELSEGSARESGLLVHIRIGLTILLLAAVRIPWRIANPPPKLEFARWLIEWTDPASRVVHYVLYALLVMVPAFGIALQFARGHLLPILGLTDILSPWIADRAFATNLKEVHEIFADLLVILALFHMSAAFMHHWISGDDILRRMLPHLHKQT